MTGTRTPDDAPTEWPPRGHPLPLSGALEGSLVAVDLGLRTVLASTAASIFAAASRLAGRSSADWEDLGVYTDLARRGDASATFPTPAAS